MRIALRVAESAVLQKDFSEILASPTLPEVVRTENSPANTLKSIITKFMNRNKDIYTVKETDLGQRHRQSLFSVLMD